MEWPVPQAFVGSLVRSKVRRETMIALAGKLPGRIVGMEAAAVPIISVGSS
jgi:hypothetical protein